MFTSILADLTKGLSIVNGSICTIAALVLGILIAYVYRKQDIASKNFTITLALLPVLVEFVISTDRKW